MARHARLGAESLAAALDLDLMPLILRFVQAAHQELLATKRIVSICVRTGALVDRIVIEYSDGTHDAHGGHGGEWRRPLKLQPGEYITGVCGHAGDGLDSITFTTSRGVTREFAGRLNGGTHFVRQITAGHELVQLLCAATENGWLRTILEPTTRQTLWQSSMGRLLLAHTGTAHTYPAVAGFVHRTGALYAGNDLGIRLCTFEQAKERAAAMPNCAGFTFESATTRFDGVQEVFFKDRANGNNDWRWQTYLCSGYQ
eukprot:2299600-Prymnesium_polylepis.1